MFGVWLFAHLIHRYDYCRGAIWYCNCWYHREDARQWHFYNYDDFPDYIAWELSKSA